MIRSRAEWMRHQGLRDWDAWMSSADLMAARATRPRTAAWLLVHGDGSVVGCTTVSAVVPDEGWTARERTQSALYLSTTCTDPAWREHRPGTRLVTWALAYAGQTGAATLRRSCQGPGLLRLYRDVQGFDLVRTVSDGGSPTHLLARATSGGPPKAGSL
ncbi:GNAT family N-acetyltransferase [Streptomyces sp. NPDC087859]|uniref:GNAT family N-acetyltransferase n=1 Tax=Streptomyces sp. NPDC087859 TaxID=3365812 RepID=UPI0038187255